MENLEREFPIHRDQVLPFAAISEWMRRRCGVPHQKRPALSARRPVHLSWRVKQDVGDLRSPPCYEAVEAAIFAGCDRFGFRLIHFSIRSDQIDLIGEADDKRSL